MGRKSKVSKELKIQACKDFEAGKYSGIEISKQLNVNSGEIYVWHGKYIEHGESSFDVSKTNKSYTKEFKLEVIKEYLTGNISLLELSIKNKIAKSMVSNWVSKYNQGIEIKDYNPKGDVYTMKKRKTTLEERIEIVKYVLINNNDYKGAADKYNVPYANVYAWVKNYNQNGENGLLDKRGRPSSTNSTKVLTEIEKLQIELEKERLKNERLERAIFALKKNEEIRTQMEKDSRNLGKKINTKR